MAVASDLPQLENHEQYRSNKDNSILLDYRGRQLGILTNNQNVVLVGPYQIAAAMKHAIIAIEDKRFYTNSGYDLQRHRAARCGPTSAAAARRRAPPRSRSSS